MSGFRRTERVAFATVLLIVLATTPAWSYIDPGSGSLFLQATLAGFLAVAFAAKNYWRTVKSWVGGRLFNSGDRNGR